MTTATTTTRRRLVATLAAAALLGLACLPHAAQGFAVGPNPKQQRPAPTSPYERRDRPATDEEGDTSSTPGAATEPFILGPGSRVAVAGADSGPLGRLVTKMLFQHQLRPYLLVPRLDKLPSGLGLDQYKGLTRYIATAPDAAAADGKGEAAAADVGAELDGLVLCAEKGYTAKEVKALLARLNGNSGNSNGSGRLKRVVMLSSVGVNRRDDLMLKLRQMHTNLEERYAAEAALMEASAQGGFDYTLVRVGRLRGGGGEQGLGFEFYDKNPNPIEARMEEDFDMTKRGFTLSYCDNIEGETGRVLAANTIVKALFSDHVANVAIAIVSEDGRTFPNFAIAPWDLF